MQTLSSKTSGVTLLISNRVESKTRNNYGERGTLMINKSGFEENIILNVHATIMVL